MLKFIFIGLLIVNYKYTIYFVKMLFAFLFGIIGMGFCFSIIGFPIGMSLISKMVKMMESCFEGK